MKKENIFMLEDKDSSLYKSSKVNQQVLAVLRENLMGQVYKR